MVFELGKELIGHNKNRGIHVQMSSFPTSHQLLAMECGGMHSHLTTKLKHDGKPTKKKIIIITKIGKALTTLHIDSVS